MLQNNFSICIGTAGRVRMLQRNEVKATGVKPQWRKMPTELCSTVWAVTEVSIEIYKKKRKVFSNESE